MTGTELHGDLILTTLGLACALGALAMGLVGGVYGLSRPITEARFRESAHATGPHTRSLTVDAEERRLAVAAYSRAAGVVAALLALLVSAPWIDGPIEHRYGLWHAAGIASGPGVYGVLAAVVWLGFVPLGVFLWYLPRPAWKRRTLRSGDWATRLGPSSSPGLPDVVFPAELHTTSPYTAALRRACRTYGINTALCAAAGRQRTSGASTAVSAIVIVPMVGTLALAGFIHAWIGFAALGLIAIWSGIAGLDARSAAIHAPGTAALDYLLLLGAARGERSHEAGVLANTYLARNPATLQDHSELVTIFAHARWIDEPSWNPVPATVREVVMPASLAMVDRQGRPTELHIAIRLVYGSDRRWRVARVWTERSSPAADIRQRHRTPVPAAWA